MDCEHKWVFQTSDYKITEGNYYNNAYYRIDTYFCEKCLKIKEIEAKYESGRNTPYWYHGKEY
jgi:hypothetical protein